jgi:hypothetical protein
VGMGEIQLFADTAQQAVGLIVGHSGVDLMP